MAESNEEYYVGVDGREISTGVIIENGKGEMLCAHCTGKKWVPGNYDIPKGHIDEGEEPYQAAVREVKEETSLDLSDVHLTDLGIYPYMPKKNLYLFWCEVPDLDVKSLKCNSYFVGKNDKEYPEVDSFKLIPINDLSYLYKGLQVTLPLAFQKLEGIKNPTNED